MAITDQEIRNAMRVGEDKLRAEVVLGLLDRIVQLQERVDKLEQAQSQLTPQ